MNDERLLFVYNPNAGRGVIKRHLSAIIELFCKEGYDVSVFATAQSGDAAEAISKRGHWFAKIVCCGGDGTLNEVTDGLMTLDNPPPCGYIPAGTVNDFAISFKLPHNMLEAAKVAISGEEFKCDIGSLNGNYFDYIAAFGAFTDVSYETPQLSKNILGKLAYFFSGVMKLTSIRKYSVTVKLDEEVIQDEIIYGMITNSFSVGGFLSLFDDEVALDDGLLEAFFIKSPKNIVEFQTIINALLTGDVTCELFYYRHISDIVIECDEPLRWTVDGEYGGEFASAEIINYTRAVSFVRGK